MESVLDISAHKYGNYHKYYTFHPSSARIKFFNSGNLFLKIWEAQDRPAVFSILDIGCNEGNLSVDVLEQAKKELPSHVQCVLLGIDLDSSLIDLANTKYSDSEKDPYKEFHAVNFMDVDAAQAFMDAYTARLQALLGNTQFSGFSLVCLFSITMWIHLNYGDEGVKDFLLRSAALLSPLGSLVVEPQPWKCYKAADKRTRKLGMPRPLHYSALTIRDIEPEMTDIVLQRGRYAPSETAVSENDSTISGSTGAAEFRMKSHWDLGKEGWGRSILIFHRSDHIGPIVVNNNITSDESAVVVEGDSAAAAATHCESGVVCDEKVECSGPDSKRPKL